MTSLPKQIPGEDRDKYKKRIVDETITDRIISDMITNNVTMVLDTDSLTNSVYSKADTNEQDAFNMVAFQFFSDKYNYDLEQHPRMPALVGDFTGYIKMIAVEDEVLDALRSGRDENPTSFARTWNDIFDQDTALFKIAALRGFKTKIENTKYDPDADAALLESQPPAMLVGNINAMIENLKDNPMVNSKGPFTEGHKEAAQGAVDYATQKVIAREGRRSHQGMEAGYFGGGGKAGMVEGSEEAWQHTIQKVGSLDISKLPEE